MRTLNRFVNLLVFTTFLGVSVCYGEEVVNMQHIGYHDDHLEHFIPFDQPDVYYDDVSQVIIINGGGEVTYYDVEIAPVSTFVPVISTQVSGFYDTIDVSSLSATEYYITISSPTGNEFEGYFEIE